MSCLVRFQTSGDRSRVVRVTAGTSLLEAAREAGLPLARGCGASGLCSRCGLQVLEGADALSPETEGERKAKQRNRVAPELRLACQARVEGAVQATAIYW